MKNKILNTKLFPHQIALFYLGQEGFIIKFQDQYILMDAYLSDYLDQNCCNENLIWKRNYEAPVKAEDLDFIDYVFCSHGHEDHADPYTLRTLSKINTKAKYIVPAPVVSLLQSYGVNADSIIPARDGEIISLGNILADPIPAAHTELRQDEHGNYWDMGYKLTLGNYTLYHAGDCVIYDGLIERLGTLDIALLPINGRDYFRTSLTIIGNMDAEEALLLAHKTNTKLLVPMHFDLYDCNCVSAAHFAALHEKQGNRQSYHFFQPGEKYIFD